MSSPRTDMAARRMLQRHVRRRNETCIPRLRIANHGVWTRDVILEKEGGTHIQVPINPESGFAASLRRRQDYTNRCPSCGSRRPPY
jgi:hypothetical protein